MEEKVYFRPGQLVKLNKKLPNAPLMMVSKIEKFRVTAKSDNLFLGVNCIWFSSDGKLQEHRFNSKDIEQIENQDE
ncbi:MAG: hypothetical protein KAH32_05990 [Chlamydiia bacterium]|nr:hypothetical protein [Chlamydiia bacterium]